MMTLCFEKTDLGSVDEELEDGEAGTFVKSLQHYF